MLSKSSLEFTVTKDGVSILNDFQTLYKDVNPDRYNIIVNITSAFKFLLVFFIIYGVLFYFRTQYVKYDKNFKIEKFILGNVQCRSN